MLDQPAARPARPPITLHPWGVTLRRRVAHALRSIGIPGYARLPLPVPFVPAVPILEHASGQACAYADAKQCEKYRNFELPKIFHGTSFLQRRENGLRSVSEVAVRGDYVRARCYLGRVRAMRQVRKLRRREARR
jgi:hypothetical protein